VTIEVHIVGRNDVAKVMIKGIGELFDDGSHGDLIARDLVFTVNEIVLPCARNQTGWSTWVGFLQVELVDKTILENYYGISAGLVDPKFKGVFQVQDFGNGLSATPYAFFIQDTNHEVIDDYPLANVRCGTENVEAFKKLYSVLPDEFDFALVMPGMQILRPDDLAENVPYAVSVSNSVKNIGMKLFDNSAHFGSSGRLKSVIYHSFGGDGIIDHEMGHTWGINLGHSLGLLTTAQGSVVFGHWNELTDIQGQMGAYYFADNGNVGHFAYNGNDTWNLVANTTVEPYSPLELYVMGLIPPEEVPPVHILKEPDLSSISNITASSVQTIKIEDIMQAEGGPRDPEYSKSQKDFTMAFIVTQDVPYNDSAYAYFSLISYGLMTKNPPREHNSLAPFYWATGGRGTLNTRLPVNLPEPVGLPGMPTSTPKPTEAPVLTETTSPTEKPDVILTESPLETPSAKSIPSRCTLPAGALVFAIIVFSLTRHRNNW